MQIEKPPDIRDHIEKLFSIERFVLAGMPPQDEASFILVEEALRNAIRELESIELASAKEVERTTAHTIATQFFANLNPLNEQGSPQQQKKEMKLRAEIMEIFASEQRQRSSIERRLKLREALRKQSSKTDADSVH